MINGSEEELSKIYDALGYVEMSAPALGLACRFRGLDVVRLLVRKGASFGAILDCGSCQFPDRLRHMNLLQTAAVQKCPLPNLPGA